METVSLKRGQIFYGLGLSGNHGQSCLFVNPAHLFLAFFDQIYTRDLLGETSHKFTANSTLTNNFRFENALRIFQYRVMEDIDDVEIVIGVLKLPLWSIEDQQTVPFSNFEDWLALLSRDEMIRIDYPVQLCDLSRRRESLDIVDTYRILSASVFDYYYKLITRERNPEDMSELFFKRLHMSEEDKIEFYDGVNIVESDINPKMSWEGDPGNSRSVGLLEERIKEGDDVKALYRYAALDIDTYNYVQSDDFYQSLWLRDLKTDKTRMLVVPEFYSPWINYAWNYNRLLDYKTITLWIETRKKISYAHEVMKNSLKARLVRFSLEDIQKMKEISMVGSCYRTRAIFTGDRSSNKVNLISNPEFIEEVSKMFIDKNSTWIKQGYVPKTAIKSSSVLELDLEIMDSEIFLYTFLNYMIREKTTGAFRFG